MNGITNVIAAAILGVAAVWGVHTWQNGQSSEMSEAEMRAFQDRTVAEVRADLESKCEMQVSAARDACTSDRLGAVDLGTTQDNFAQTNNEPSTDRYAELNEVLTTTSSDSYTASQPTAVLGTTYGGGDDPKPATSNVWQGQSAPIDKPDTGKYFTEDSRMGEAASASSGSPTSGLVDKPDSNRYFTQDQRMDSPEYGSPTKGLVDKPDSKNYYTENKRMRGPCEREDGSIYSGPGTATDPFAEGDPCLVTQKFVEHHEVGPCEIDPVTGVAKPYIDPVTGLDLCATSTVITTTHGDYKITENDGPCVIDPVTGMRKGYNPALYPEGDPCITYLNETPTPEILVTSIPEVSIPPSVDLPPVIPPLPPYNVPQAPVTNPTPYTNVTWTAPYPSYTLPWLTNYHGPMPTVRGGSDYRSQECAD